jgi:hypothetical protein
MELYASGFNGWTQLQFCDSSGELDKEDPEDLLEFACVLREQRIDQPKSFLSYTVGNLARSRPN